MVKVTFQETEWTVSRQPPPAGWRAEGERLQPRESGLCFRSPSGETRFLPLDSAELPSQAQLDSMTVAQLAVLWQRATQR